MRSLLVAVLLIVVLLGAMAFALDWFNVQSQSTDTASTKEMDIKVTIDKDKVKEDLNSVQETTKELGKKAVETGKAIKDKVAKSIDSTTADETVEGVVTAVAADSQQLDIRTEDGRMLSLDVQESAEVVDEQNETLSLSNLKSGQRVSVSYNESDGKLTAVKVKLVAADKNP